MRKLFIHNCSERGYFLLEAIFLGILVLAMTSGMMLYVQSRKANMEDGCRVQAIYLAHYQIAAVEQKMSDTDVEEKSLPWLGRDEELQSGNVSYRVASELTPCDGGKLLKVTVSWNKTGKEGKATLEKVIVKHG